METLFDECIKKIGSSTIIYNLEDSKSLSTEIFNSFEFGLNGVDWNHYENKIELYELNEILNLVKDDECYVMWDDYDVPILKANLKKLLINIDDVLAVSFDTWFIGADFKWIVEFHHEGKWNVFVMDVLKA